MKKIIYSFNPSTNELLWMGKQSTHIEILNAVEKGKNAQKFYCLLSLEERKKILLNFSEIVKRDAEKLARIISLENGKPFWEAKTEVAALSSKVNAVISSFEEKMHIVEKELTNGRRSITRYKAHGLLVVIGPYNFPMSMPNSHIMPAILAGNSVIFKPSEKTPMCAEVYFEIWKEAGLPDSVLQIVYGDDKVGKKLVRNDNINGVLFIGSRRAGLDINTALAKKTDKICVLEMGGNSPLMIWDYENVRYAINIAIQSAFLSAGQRCSCARRLIVNSKLKDSFIPLFIKAVSNIVIGDAFSEDLIPFMGPVIDENILINFYQKINEYKNLGAKILLEPHKLSNLGTNFVTPAILDTTNINVPDEEVFGPFLQVIFVDSFEDGVEECNKTSYGLAAGIVCKDRNIYEQFFSLVQAGIINWNQPLTGSSGTAPFGGIKLSGNHHPAGYFSCNYCSYSVASIESPDTSEIKRISNGLKF